jgi:serine/threonine kinase PknH
VDGTPFGRYRLIELLGRGGMGEVWRAYDTTIGRVVALKVLPPNLADDERFKKRFRREARAAAILDEPHVVPIYDFGEIDGRLYVTMRLIEGRDMQAILADGPLEPLRAVAIIEQIASALHAAHRTGLVHRDVKPSNILVAEDDFAYLIDFGIARTVEDTSGLTDTGKVVGTWAYLAPERLSEGQIEPRADIYSLTCVLHECLTGSQPFPSNSIEQLIVAHISKPPPRPSALRHGLPAEVDPVIAKGMAKDPEQRYSTTRELAKAAREAITDPIPRPRPVLPPKFRPELPPMPPQLETDIPRFAAVDVQTSPPVPPLQPAMDGGDSLGAVTEITPATEVSRAMEDSPAMEDSLTTEVSPTTEVFPTTEVCPTTELKPSPPASDVPPPTRPVKNRKRRGISIAAALVAVAVIAIGIAVAVTNRGGGRDSVAASPSPTALPNSGPFTGVYRSDFGPENTAFGKAFDTGTASGSFSIRSACGSNGCVAVAVTSQPSVIQKTLLFDDVGGNWLSVGVANGAPESVSPGLLKSCNGGNFVDIWEVITLQPKPDGTLSGQYTAANQHGCGTTRTVTFARTGDVEVASLPDPGSQARRVVTPAEGLRGHYRRTFTWPGRRAPTVSETTVNTSCLRTGDRCLSSFHDVNSADVMIFADGKWTWNTDHDYDCSPTQRTHTIGTAEYLLPAAAPDPIILLTGQGHSEVPPGNACSGSFDFQSKYERIGD